MAMSAEFARSYNSMGVSRLYDWQRECIESSGVLDGHSLVYCAPTGGGKTMVAELAMIKCITGRKRKAMLVLPYVALVREKEKYMKRLVRLYNLSQSDRTRRIRIKAYHGDTGPFSCSRYDILVCTIEKSNGLLNTLICQGLSHRLGCVVIDEMHLLGDRDRGYHLEILVSKLKYLRLRTEMLAAANRGSITTASSVPMPPQTQMIALSATVGNISTLASWFNAALYRTDHRPITLKEHLVVAVPNMAAIDIMDNAAMIERSLPLSAGSYGSALTSRAGTDTGGTSGGRGARGGAIAAGKSKQSPEEAMEGASIALVSEGLRDGCQVLVFCASRNACQLMCKRMSSSLAATMKAQLVSSLAVIDTSSSSDAAITHEGNPLQGQGLMFQRREAVATILSQFGHDISRFPGVLSLLPSISADLCEGIISGCAFHHAGLTETERAVVEHAYRIGAVSVLMCTSTLAAGVNLPAGRVVIHGMRIGFNQSLSVVQYRQMCGRAGRAGHVSKTTADAFLVVKSVEKAAALELMNATYPNVCSQMNPLLPDGSKAVLRAIVELCFLGLCSSLDTLKMYVAQTLFYAECSLGEGAEGMMQAFLQMAVGALQFLLNAEVLEENRGTDSSMTTPHQDLSRSFHMSRLGKAIVATNINPDEAIIYYSDLLLAQEYLNLETDLFVALLCAPLQQSSVPVFQNLLSVYCNAKEKENPLFHVMSAIGLNESVLLKWYKSPPNTNLVSICEAQLRQARGCSGALWEAYKGMQRSDQGAALKTEPKIPSSASESELVLLCRTKRLWIAQIIVDLMNCMDNSSVARVYGLSVGDVQQLHHSAVLISSKMAEFCNELGWSALSQIIRNFLIRLENVESNSSDSLSRLMSIQGMSQKVARVLMDTPALGSVEAVAKATPEALAQCLRLSCMFEGIDFAEVDTSLIKMGNNSAPSSSSTVPSIARSPNSHLASASSSSPAITRTPTRMNSRKRKSIGDTSGGSGSTAFGGEGEDGMVVVRPAVASRWRSMNGQLLIYAASLIENASLLVESETANPGNANVEEDPQDTIDAASDSSTEEGGGNEDLEPILSDEEGAIDVLTRALEPSQSGLRDEEAFESQGIEPWLRRAASPPRDDDYGAHHEAMELHSFNLDQSASFDLNDDGDLSSSSETDADGFAVPGRPKRRRRKRRISALAPLEDRPMRPIGGDGDEIEVESELAPPVTAPVTTAPQDVTGEQIPEFGFELSDDVLIAMMDSLEKRQSLRRKESFYNSSNVSDAVHNLKEPALTPSDDILTVHIPEEVFVSPGAVGATTNTSDYVGAPVSQLGPNSEDASMLQVSNVSPFITPFTPSKVHSVGKYLCYGFHGTDDVISSYDPIGIHVSSTAPMSPGAGVSSSTTAIAAAVEASKPMLASEVLKSENRSRDALNFSFVDLRKANMLQANEFLNQLSHARSVSFELILRAIPGTSPALRFNSRGVDPKSAASMRRRWQALSTSRRPGETTSHSSSEGPFVVTGVALNFGDDTGYYMPLPCPLPSRPPKNRAQAETIASSWGTLPSAAAKIVCRFVGFRSIFSKCSTLSTSYTESNKRSAHSSASMSAITSPSTPSEPISGLSLANKHWMHAFREALLAEWRLGACLEWKLFATLMASENTTKICLHLKDTLSILLHRDVASAGSLECPIVAQQLLGGVDATGVKYAVPGGSNARRLEAQSAFRAFYAFKHMAELEAELYESSMMELYRNVEMPLCRCVSRMQSYGMPINASFFTRLRQDLNDRCKLIEYYFSCTEGPSFKLASDKNVALFKQRVGKDILKYVSDELKSSDSSVNSSDTINRRVEDMMSKHPLINLLSEWRVHSSAIIMLSSIISAISDKSLDGLDSTASRVFGIFHTIGAASGRLIVTSPPLQQMPHECSYLRPLRPSVHDEVVAYAIKELTHGAPYYAGHLRVACEVLSSKWLLKAPQRSEVQWVRVASDGDSITDAKLLEVFAEVPKASTTLQLALTYAKVKARGGGSASALDVSTLDDSAAVTSIIAGTDVYRLQAPLLPHDSEIESINYAIRRFSKGGSAPQLKVSNDSRNHTMANGNNTTASGTTSPAAITVSPREGFVAPSGFVLMSADYSQIEFRILAHFTGDEALIQPFFDRKVDVFKGICAKWKKKPADMVSESERDMTKQLCYAIIYGAGASRIAAVAGCSEAEAKQLYSDFLHSYPSISRFIAIVKRDCRRYGYVTTLLGRRRYFPELLNAAALNKEVAARLERQAVNTVCQGSAADLVKLAMVNIEHRFMEEFHGGIPLFRSAPGGGLYKRLPEAAPRMVLQIHDELLFEVPERRVHRVAAIVRECMEGAVQLRVPLQVKLHVGPNWADLKLLQ